LNTINRTISNAIFNVFGWLWPAALNLLTLPYVVSRLGEEAFGIFTLVLAVLGYFAFLDLGLNTASVKYIAEYWAKEDSDRINQVIGSTLVVYTTLGCLGSLVIWLATEWLITDVLKISTDLVGISRIAFRVGSLGFLVNMVSGTFSAVPRALQRFDIVNKVTIGLTTLSTLSTMVVLAMGAGLMQVVVVRFAINLLSIVIFLSIAKRLIPSLIVRPQCTWSTMKELLRFGGLSAVNKVASQAMFHLNRLLLGSFLGLASVTYYVVPANLTSLMHRFLSSLTSVLFPLSSELSARREDERLQNMYVQVTKYITVLATAIYLSIILFSFPLLRFWMGQAFANQGSSTLLVLALSFYALSFNAVAYHVLNGVGRPDVNAISAVVGGVLSIGFCLILIPRIGILGAAVANLISMVRIPIYILYVNKQVLKINNSYVFKRLYLKIWLIGAMIISLFFLIGISPGTIWELGGMFAVLVFLYVILMIVLGVLDAKDKALFFSYFQVVAHRYSRGNTESR